MEQEPRRPSISLIVTAALAVAIVAAAAAGCGGGAGDGRSEGDSEPATPTDATLVLDFVPNAVHTGIYCALGRGYYERAGISLEVIEPTSTADTLKLIDSGKAEFGIADPIDVAEQITRGRGAKAIMALVQRPLGGLITLEEAGITDPGQLEGRTVGVTGVPSDEAVLETLIAAAGGDPARAEVVTIGFNGVQSLENRKIDAFTGFTAADGTQVEADGFPVTSFALDEYGGPRYPGLVVFSTEERIGADPELTAAFVAATARGYEATLEDPAACLEELLAANPALEERLQRAQLDAYLPLFGAGGPPFGILREKAVADLAAFLVDTGLAAEEITFDRFGTNEFVPGGGGNG